MAGRERIVPSSPGDTIRIVSEDGSFVIDFKNRPAPNTLYSVEKKSLEPREEQREQLKAKYPDVLFPYAIADLTRLSYKAVPGGEEIGSQLTLDEAETNMRKWIEDARKSGFSDKEIGKLSASLLREYNINPILIKGVNIKVENLVKEIWGLKKNKRQKSKTRS